MAILSRHLKSNPYTGISVYTVNLANLLVDIGYSVTIFSEPSSMPLDENPHDFEIVEIPIATNLIKSMFEMRTPHPVARWLSQVSRPLEDYSVVIAPIVGLQSMIFRSRLNGTKILTLHTPYPRTTPLGVLYRYLQSKSIWYSDNVIANSKTIVGKFKVSGIEKVVYVPHEATLIVNRQGFPLEQRWLWVGALSFRKGIDRLFLILLKNRKNNIDVVYSTTRSSYLLELILKYLEIIGFCTIHKQIKSDALNKLYNSSFALISTSRFESFGLTLVEAAARSRGTIGINSKGVTETMPNGEGAVWVNGFSALVRELKSHSNSRKFWENLGRVANGYVSVHYSNRRIAAILKELIH